MKYRHTFRVQAPLSDVAEFHSQGGGMDAITPPPIRVRFDEAPQSLTEGDLLAFTLWLGPFPIRWQARIEAVSPQGFIDRQISGPFQSWVHRHRYSAISADCTEVEDHIEAQLRNPPWLLIGLGMWLGMPLLFAYRAWKTRRLLDHNSHALSS